MTAKFVRTEPEEGTPTMGVVVNLLVWELLLKQLALVGIPEPRIAGWVVCGDEEDPDVGTRPPGPKAGQNSIALSCPKCDGAATASPSDIAVFMREGWPTCCGRTMDTRRI